MTGIADHAGTAPPRRDRPNQRPCPLWRLRVKREAANGLIAVEHVIIIVRPFAARSPFKQMQ